MDFKCISATVWSTALHLSPSRWRFAPLLLPALCGCVCVRVYVRPPLRAYTRVCACVCARPCMSYSGRDIYTGGRRLSCGICLFLVRYSEYVTQITILLSVPPLVLLIRTILNFARFVPPSLSPHSPSRPYIICAVLASLMGVILT